MLRTSLYYQKEYVDNLRSIRDIAREHGTYENKIRREILSFGYQLRDKSEAQKVALQSGRHKHPTKGRERTDEEKSKISISVTRVKNNGKTKEE